MAVIRKNGKIYEDRTVKGHKYVYEVTIDPTNKKKKKFSAIKDEKERRSLLASFDYRKKSRKQNKQKEEIQRKEKRIFEEFGDTPGTRKALKDIKEKLKDQGKTLDDISYNSLASRMIGAEDREENIHLSELNKAKKLIRNLGYTEKEFQDIYGISAEQLSHSKTANGEITIGGKVYAIKFNYTGYEDLVYLRDA